MSLTIDLSNDQTLLKTYYVTEAKSNKVFRNILRNPDEKKYKHHEELLRNYNQKNLVKINTNRNFSTLNKQKDFSESITLNPLSHSKETYIKNFKTNFMTNYNETNDPEIKSKIPFVKSKRRVESIVELQKRNLDSHLFYDLTESSHQTKIQNKKIHQEGIHKKMVCSVDWSSYAKPKNNQIIITTSKSKFINDMFSRNPFSKDESLGISKPITDSSFNKKSKYSKDIESEKMNQYHKFRHVYKNGKGYYL